MKKEIENMDLTFFHEVNKSKFIAFVFEVNSINEFNDLYLSIVDKHPRAKQICYAYKINDNGLKSKAFNDTEPKGIALNAIYSLIEKKELVNVAIIVVRYFGGTKLGKSNLYRAYAHSTNEVLKIFLEKKHI